MKKGAKGIGLAIIGAGRVGLFRGEVAARHPAVEWIGIAELNHNRGGDVGARIGADFITTQLFFDNAAYFSFVDRCRALGIKVPIVPGLMPALSHTQVKKFTAFCGARYPDALAARLSPLDTPGSAPASEAAGVAWADAQIRALLAARVPGLHLLLRRGRHVRRPE